MRDYDDDEGPGPAQYFGKFNWAICDTCDGHGKYVNPDIDSHGLSREDFDEDPDFREDYFSGVYDVTCWKCNGSGKMKVPAWDRMTFGEKRELIRWQRDEADYRATRRMEMGLPNDRRYG
jgi:hypothetical protein